MIAKETLPGSVVLPMPVIISLGFLAGKVKNNKKWSLSCLFGQVISMSPSGKYVNSNCMTISRVYIFAKVQGHFKRNTRPYFRSPSCRATKTASDVIKTMQKRLIFYGGLKVWFSIKRHKTRYRFEWGAMCLCYKCF